MSFSKWITALSLGLLLLVNSIHAIAETPSHFSELFTNQSEDDPESILSVDEAFQVKLLPGADPHHAHIVFKVADGHYLYQERIQITLADPGMGEIKQIKIPKAEEKIDPIFGKTKVYHYDFTVDINFDIKKSGDIKVRYQGCSEKGLCYPPQFKSFSVAATSFTQTPTQSAANTQANQTSVSQTLLQSGSWWKIVLGFLGAGLLLAFTPCVFPMIPILSSIIVGKNAQSSRMKAFTLSLAYVLGMCVTYTLAGIAAGLSGQLLSNALQTPLALSIAASVFVLLALSMFGLYELKLPSFIENYFLNWGRNVKGGHLLSDFFMGVLSALIISPCVAAPLAGALLYISQTQDVVLGGVALFSLSLGMGTPLLLIGASAGSLLPKAGIWMNAVRQFFGILMLAVALWVIGPILPNSVVMVLWALLCIVPAIYMRAIDPLPADTPPITRLIKAFAVVLLFWGLMILIGVWSGANSPLKPLSAFTGKHATQTQQSIQFQRIQSTNALDQALKANQGKIVMLDFYADWCVSCKEYEQYVFTDARVKAHMQQMTLLQVDATANSEQDQALLKRFGLFGLPGIVFFNQQGESMTPIVTGYQPAEQFTKTLSLILATQK